MSGLHSLPVAYETSDFVALYDLLNRRSRRRFLLVLLAALLVNLVLLIPSSALPIAAHTLPYVVLTLLVIGVLSSPKFGGWIAYRQSRATYGVQPYSHSIQPDAFVASGEQGEIRLNWKHIPRLECAAGRLFVFNGKKSAIITPVRAFPDPESFDRFVNGVKERWRAERE